MIKFYKRVISYSPNRNNYQLKPIKIKMSLFIKILFIFPLVISCQNSIKNDSNQLVTFDLKGHLELSNVKLSDLNISDIEYIPLETNEKSMIDHIEELSFNWGNVRIMSDEKYFLIKIRNKILKFRIDGKFEGMIGTQGRGPTEFQVAHDLDINIESHNIYLVSAWQKKFNVYSEDGKFVRTFPIPAYAPISFRFVDGKILCYFDDLQGNIKNSYVLMDTNGIVIKNFKNKYPFEIHNIASGFPHENLFYQFNDRLYKKEIYSDTIFLFENMNFIPHIVIETGERLITPEIRSKYDGSYIGEYYIQPLNLFEFGDFVFYEFIYKAVQFEASIYGLIASKKGNYEAIFDMEQGLINDLDGGLNILPITIKNDSTAIAIIDVLKLKSHVSSYEFKNSTPKYPEKKKELEKLSASLKETDNPVLLLMKLKK